MAEQFYSLQYFKNIEVYQLKLVRDKILICEMFYLKGHSILLDTKSCLCQAELI